jgi:hypothetical protein
LMNVEMVRYAWQIRPGTNLIWVDVALHSTHSTDGAAPPAPYYPAPALHDRVFNIDASLWARSKATKLLGSPAGYAAPLFRVPSVVATYDVRPNNGVYLSFNLWSEPI